MLTALLAVAAVGLGLATSAARAAPATGETITFGNVTCAPGWLPPQPGRDRFTVENDSSRPATVYLFRADSGRIVATLRDLAPGRTRTFAVSLAPGPYAWGCDLRGYPRHVSEAQRVSGHRQAGGSGPVVVPVTLGQLEGPLGIFRHYVARRIARLRGQVATLRRVVGGDTGSGAGGGWRARARAAWLPARLTWLSVGEDDGAYGAFGDLGRRIDGTTAGYPGGAADPHFTGLHRVERDLWHGADRARTRRDVDRLAALVAQLAATPLSQALPGDRAGASAFTLRVHEILEDALRDTLSGEDDEGSHTALAALGADVAVTRWMLGLWAPLLAPRAPALVGTARGELTRLDGALHSAQLADRRPAAVGALPRRTRETIDGDTGAALETLARIPDLLSLTGT